MPARTRLLLLTMAVVSRSYSALEQTRRADVPRPPLAQRSPHVGAKKLLVAAGAPRATSAGSTSQHRWPSRQTSLVVGLALLAGWTDSICFKIFGYYPNLMTGHTIRLSSALAERRWRDAGFFVLLLMHYLFGIGVHRAAVIKEKKQLPSLVAPAVLLLFMLADRGALYHTEPLSRLDILPLCVAYGLINAVSLENAGTRPSVLFYSDRRVAYI